MGYNTKEEILLNSSKTSLEESLGKCGGVLLTNAATTGKFIAVTAIAEAQLSTTGTLTLTATTIPAGVTVYGRFSSLTAATANTFIAYYEC
jgi:ABC-type sulfate transport system permease subunit